MSYQVVNTTANHDQAIRYPYEDTAASMANEMNRMGKKRSTGGGRLWKADACGVCDGFHVVNDANGLYLTR